MASQDLENLAESGEFYHQMLEEMESYLLDPSFNLDHFISCAGGGDQGKRLSAQAYEQLCPIESLMADGSNISFSPNRSSINLPDFLSYTYNSVRDNSPVGVRRACLVDGANETELGGLKTFVQPIRGSNSQIGGAHDTANLGACNQFLEESEFSRQAIGIIHGKNLKEMLVACAKAVTDNDLLTSERLMTGLRSMVSVCGDPLQRLGAYMLEGLVARLASSGSSIYKALKCKEPTGSGLLSYMHLLYEVCPYFKFGYLSANGAIAEAIKNEKRVHIIDFQISQGSQWITLIQALAARPGGAPHIRITGIDDSVSAHAGGVGLEIVGQRLSGLAKSCGVPFEFHAVAISACDIESEHLRIQPGEALAVNFALTLHHMPDESVFGVQNHRDRLLRMVKNMAPKVVTLVEQELNTNTAPFFLRFIRTLEYYLAVFGSIDMALPREHKERIKVEQHCLARDIVNIIACEGPERVERHELLGKWRLRFHMAGFAQFPLNSSVNATIKTLLENYTENYCLKERDGCLYLGWVNQDLVGSCAWE